MKAKHQRGLWLLAAMISITIGVTIITSVFQNQLVFFYSPSDVLAQEIPAGKRIRLGGMVKENSIEHDQEALYLRFIITDYAHETAVEYTGIMPPLFREQQGMIAEGSLDEDGVMQAERLLTKHDENYMPPEVKRALESKKNTTTLPYEVNQ